MRGLRLNESFIVLLTLLLMYTTTVLSSPLQVFSQWSISKQCGTQNSLCGTEWVPECCPGLQCTSDNGFWICDN